MIKFVTLLAPFHWLIATFFDPQHLDINLLHFFLATILSQYTWLHLHPPWRVNQTKSDFSKQSNNTDVELFSLFHCFIQTTHIYLFYFKQIMHQCYKKSWIYIRLSDGQIWLIAYIGSFFFIVSIDVHVINKIR